MRRVRRRTWDVGRRTIAVGRKGLYGVAFSSYFLLSTSHAAYAMEVKPVINAQVLGGQYFYNANTSDVGAVASLTASPYMKFDDKWSLVPLYSGYYQGTQQVQDLIGGGTLFQESQDHIVSVKGIRSFSNGLRLKAVSSYGVNLLKETKDESWGAGLYDNRRLSAGTEAEWSWAKDDAVRLAYDYYGIRFPNYQSLSSQATSSGLGREFDAPDVLNSNNHMLTLGSEFRVAGNGRIEGFLSHTWSSFPDQHIVDLSGALTAETRADGTDNLSIQGTWPLFSRPLCQMIGMAGYSRTHLESNQNHYDAGQTFFNPNFYSYVTNGFKTNLTALVGEAPWTISLDGNVSRQQYTNRLVQDSAGTYGTEITHVDYAAVGLAVSYPIAKGFQLKGNIAFGWNDSNNTDVSVYQYHYNTQSYLFGFTYAY